MTEQQFRKAFRVPAGVTVHGSYYDGPAKPDREYQRRIENLMAERAKKASA